MEALLDRVDELQRLRTAARAAARGQPQLVVVWGRRRVGKTFLLSHFARRERSVYFGATQQSERVELARFAAAVRAGLGDRTADLLGGAFGSWETALRAVAALAEGEPLCVVLDEVPYLARSTPGFASIVQVVWDHLRRPSRLVLALAGSSIGVIESMLGADGALRGRPTLAMRIDPLDTVAARVFLPRLSASRYLEAYAACGGYPLHLRAWDDRASTRENLRRLAATAGGLLLEDAEGILREELSETGGYSRILAAVGRGRARYGQIASEAGQRVEAPLEVLVRAGFLRKALPVGAPKGARPLYEIPDPYLAFWFSCLYANQAPIASGQGRALLDRIDPLWQRHVGWVFEEAARAHAARLVARGELTRGMIVGRWWASSGEPCEVDVLGLLGKRTALLGEVRWQQAKLAERDLAGLEAKRARVPDAVDRPVLALWGRSGVTAGVRRRGALGFSLADVLATR